MAKKSETPAKRPPRQRWRVVVTKKENGEEMDIFPIMASHQAIAERIGVLFSADHWVLQTSQLEGKAEPWDEKRWGVVTKNKYDYLAAARIYREGE